MPAIKIIYAVGGVLNGISCTCLALFVLSRGWKNPENRAYCLFALPIGLFNLLYFFWALAGTAQEALEWFIPLMTFVIMVNPFFLWFVATITGSSRKKNISVLVSFLLNGFFLIANWNGWLYSAMVSRYGLGWWPVITRLCVLYHLIWLWHAVLGHVWLWQGFKTSTGARRQQLKWTLIGTTVGYGGAATNWFLWYNIPIPPLLNILVTPFQLIIAYAIVKHKLMDIRVAVKRGLVYSLLIACLTAAYLLVVLITERWFQGFFGYRSFVATLVVAFLTAIFFNPLRERIQAFVDRAILKATPAELATQREQLLVEVRKGDQQKAVATLAAGLAHEVKNPLAAIKTFTEHLGTHYDDPAFRVKFQKIVGGEVERINLIVQQLLEFAKPVPPKLTPLQLEPLLEETLEFLGSEFTSRHVHITRHYAATPATILGDPKQLKQVFLNLFLNSLQAMNGEGGQLTLTTARAGSELTITIQDTGCGIKPEDLPHLFTPFYTTKPQGTGLGLAVVQSIITEHGGTIRVASTVGRGTELTMRLPVST